jgi:hypothetical protein
MDFEEERFAKRLVAEWPSRLPEDLGFGGQ